ncbi:hypothetical protein [Nocardia pseudovaccinii]|uniref:hypothetical protein n=1 Tax=Nocardia pseudovaccinii TaxID=189540 RepID=UPI000AF0832A|nr:hypothetical protein [Nocardia pseudovaccinii]
MVAEPDFSPIQHTKRNDIRLVQNPNVPEEAPGIPWDAPSGEIYVHSFSYDPKEGPLSDGVEPDLPTTATLHALWQAIRDESYFGGDTEGAVSRIAPLMSAFMCEGLSSGPESGGHTNGE